MSTSADDQYEQQNDTTTGDVPSGVKTDNDYASRTGQYQIPVQKDETPVTDPIDPATADSDEMLGMPSSPPIFPPSLLLPFLPSFLPSFSPDFHSLGFFTPFDQRNLGADVVLYSSRRQRRHRSVEYRRWGTHEGREGGGGL